MSHQLQRAVHALRYSCWFGLIALVLLALPCAAAAGPHVAKAEPPNWWIGLPPSPMLLLTGTGLNHASAETSYPGVRVVRAESSGNGHYLFVWTEISRAAKPGTVPLRIRTAQGSTTVSWPLAARSNPSGKYQGLSPEDVIYLIMPDRFADGDTRNDEPAPQLHTYDRANPKAWHGGDLQGIRQRLSYLHDLGITALWLTPFWKNDWRADDFSYHGYHVEDFYSVDEHFGTMEDLQALAADAHRLGIKLVLDFVVNHTGPHHPWANDPPDPQWLHGTAAQHADADYQFNGLVDPHASPRQYRNVVDGWFANKLPDLNTEDPELAQYLLENAEWWMESGGLDAFRLDTFPYSSRRFWSGWHTGIFKAYPDTFSVGEVWDGDPSVTSFFAGGRAERGVDTHLPTVFDFPLAMALRDVLVRNQPASRIPLVLRNDWLYPHPEWLVTFFGNHDMRRFLSEAGSTPAKLQAAFSLLLTLRGIPQIYAGDEIGMRGGDDPDNRRDFPGGFPGDPRSAFDAGERSPDQQAVFAHVQALLALRRKHPALREGRQWHIGFGDHYYAYLREQGGDRVLVVFNDSDAPLPVDLSLSGTPLEGARTAEPLHQAAPAEITGDVLHVTVPARTASIYEMPAAAKRLTPAAGAVVKATGDSR